MTKPDKSRALKLPRLQWPEAKIPNEHPVATFREWAKIVVPLLALIVATIAGAIAFKQYLLASASAERQDRAYLLPDRVEIDIHPDTIPIVRVVIKNFGKTPASNFTVTSQCKVVRSPSSVFEKPTDPRVLLNVIIAPTGASTFFQDCGEKTTQDDIDNLRAHQVSIYFTAQLKYRDVFNRSHRSIIRRFVGGSAGLRDNAMANSANLGEGDEAD